MSGREQPASAADLTREAHQASTALVADLLNGMSTNQVLDIMLTPTAVFSDVWWLHDDALCLWDGKDALGRPCSETPGLCDGASS